MRILLVIFGCIAGLIVGMSIGEILGYTGGASIGAFAFGVVGMPLGGLIVILILIYFSKRRNKAQQSLK